MERKKIILATVFVAIAITLIVLYQRGLIDLQSTLDYIGEAGVLGWIIFVLIYIVAVAIAFPASLLTIAAGFLFNSLLGFILVLIGASIGALVAFLISRYLFQDYFHHKFANSKLLNWSKIEDQRKLTSITFFMRLVPIFPFNALNFGLGLTKIKARNYFLASLIGMAPGTFVYVFLGSSLSNVFSMKFVIAILVLVGFTVLAYWMRKKVKFKSSGEIDIPIDSSEIIIAKEK